METSFVTNTKGKKISVILSLKKYQKLLDATEELEDIRLYDSVKAKKEESIPLEEYIRERKKNNHARV